MVNIVEIDNASATQTEHPTRAMIRTFFQTFLPALPLFVLAVPPVIEVILDETSRRGVTLPPGLYAALAGIALGCAVVAAVVARVMAVPEVERALRKVGLSAAPTEPDWVYRHDGADSDEVEPVDDDMQDPVDEPDGPSAVDVLATEAPVETPAPEAEPDTVVYDEEIDPTPPVPGWEPRH